MPKAPRLKAIRRFGTPLPGLTRKQADERMFPPGQHGARLKRQRKSAYRERLEEKQKLRLHYGISESQLQRYFRQAAGRPGVTGEILLAQLERRLDNVVFRLGFAPTIPAARQIVSHGHILVDGFRVDIPSYAVDPGNTIAVSPRGRQIPYVIEAVQHGPEISLPGYLALDPDDPFTGRMTGLPARDDVPFIVGETAIVEFYAR